MKTRLGEIESAERYLSVCDWARKRYTRNGRLTLFVGGKPSRYVRIENLAWNRYVKA